MHHWTNIQLRKPRCTTIVAAFTAIAACTALIAAPPAGATSAEEVVNEGTLEFISSTPANVVFPATTLSGKDQTATAAQSFDVKDARGTGKGWNITATSTTFKSTLHALSTSATTIGSTPTIACDSGATCTKAETTISYPYALPAGETAPTATKMFNAKEGTGLGDQTITPTWSLAIPASTYAGTYTSTWTLTLATGP